jgi:CheY-like chemotaxis protein
MTQPLNTEPSEPKHREKFRVLAAEDNPGDALLLLESFKSNGGGDFEVVNAADLDQTLRILSEEPVDLVCWIYPCPCFWGWNP